MLCIAHWKFMDWEKKMTIRISRKNLNLIMSRVKKRYLKKKKPHLLPPKMVKNNGFLRKKIGPQTKC